MALINPSLPIVNQPDSSEEPKIPTALSQILAQLNGGLDSTNIADGSIQPADIASTLADLLGITAGGVTRRGFAQVSTLETTTSASDVDLATLGPSVTVTVPANGLVLVHAEVDIKNSVSVANGAFVTLVEDGVTIGSVLHWTGAAFQTIRTTPGTTDIGTSGHRALGGWLVFPAASGARTYKLRYAADSGTTATFQNRKMWVWAVGP